jgi:hypothetical protein
VACPFLDPCRWHAACPETLEFFYTQALRTNVLSLPAPIGYGISAINCRGDPHCRAGGLFDRLQHNCAAPQPDAARRHRDRAESRRGRGIADWEQPSGPDRLRVLVRTATSRSPNGKWRAIRHARPHGRTSQPSHGNAVARHESQKWPLGRSARQRSGTRGRRAHHRSLVRGRATSTSDRRWGHPRAGPRRLDTVAVKAADATTAPPPPGSDSPRASLAATPTCQIVSGAGTCSRPR